MTTHTEQSEHPDSVGTAVCMTGASGGLCPFVQERKGQGEAAGCGSEGTRLLELQARHFVSRRSLEDYSEKVKILLGWL